MDGQVWKSAAPGAHDAPGGAGALGDVDVSGARRVFAELLRTPEQGRDDLLERAIEEDVRGLSAQALLVCQGGSTGEVLCALKVLEEAFLTEECPELLPDAARVLTGLCRADQDPEVLAAALPVFGWYTPGPSTARTLLEMAAHPVPAVRKAAVEGMEHFADERTFPPVVMDLVQRLALLLTDDPDIEVRLAAVGTFTTMDCWTGFDESWAPQMVAVLARVVGAGPDPRLRRAAAENLVKLLDPEGRCRPLVTEALRPYVEDPDPYVAAWALAWTAAHGDPQALDRLWTVVAAPDVHRIYLTAAVDMFVPYRDAAPRHRRRLRRALAQLRRQGWANASADEPGWTPQARDDYLKILISSVSPWWAPWWLPWV
jgi:hypothetical protein